MITWEPDFCPPGQGRCVIEIERDWSAPRRFVSLCTHHQELRTGLSDAQLFAIILQSCRVKETARAVVKAELGLDKEHPGVPYRVGADGNFTVLTTRPALAWIAPDGSPGAVPNISASERTRARAAAALAVQAVVRPVGTSIVTVE